MKIGNNGWEIVLIRIDGVISEIHIKSGGFKK
jgi:hypothetical protein